MSEFYVGLDLGQQDDYTALAIIERVSGPVPEPAVERIERGPRLPPEVERLGLPMPVGLPTVVEERVTYPAVPIATYHLRHLERVELGTTYPQIVRYVAKLVDRRELAGSTTLVLDATGVGRPVVDAFRESAISAPIVPITITGGDVVQHVGSEWHVPKRDLVTAPLLLMQQGRLGFARRLPLRDILVAEMQNFRATINLAGHDSYAAGPDGEWREGAHDDIVLSVALACWFPERNGGIGSGARLRFFE